LPRYTERRWNKTEQKHRYLFNVPSWAQKPGPDDNRGPCPVKSEALGTDYKAAVERVETVLLPQFDAWRTHGLSDVVPRGPTRGTFDWLASVYRRAPQYQTLSTRMKGNFEYGLRLSSEQPLKDDPLGRTRFGQLALSEISPGVVDKLYARIKIDREPVVDDAGLPIIGNDGKSIVREIPRLRRAQEAIKACRRAWNVARRNEPHTVPQVNPFEKAEVEAPKRGTTVPATLEQVLTFVKACDDAGEWSIGTAALAAFLWFQREEHIMGMPRDDGRVTGLLWADYRPREAPDCVRVQHPKTNETVVLPLYADDGRPLFPELMDRLDRAAKRASLICVRDKPDATGVHRPWPTGAKAGGMSPFIRRVAKIRDAAGLPKELTFRTFRVGGFTAGGEADLSDADINAVGAKTDATLDIYRKGTLEQRRRALTRLLDQRSNEQRLSTQVDKATQPEPKIRGVSC
jgi:hypothetical protein